MAPLVIWPPQPLKFLRWLPNYFLPWNLLFLGLGAVIWFFLTPSQETLQTLDWRWILFILIRNAAMVFLLYGALELRLYLRRAQGNRFKFNALFPADKKSDVFLFKSQNIDNMIRCFGTGVPIWTAYEVGMLYAWAHGWGPWATFGDSPVALILLWLAIPLIHEAHFYCIHRLIHVPILYKYVHSVHHNSINPSPWSSLSMHPVEAALFFAEMMWHLVIPSNPFVALFQLNTTAYGAIVGHIGFDKLELTDGHAMDSHAYTHYLHHKYFEVNYGGDGLIPLDQWFGTWHDGTKQADEQMKQRFRRKKERVNARKTTGVSAE